MSLLKKRLTYLREADEADKAREAAFKAASEAKHERMATLLSRRWPEIEAHLNEAREAVSIIGGDLRYKTITYDAGNYVTLRIEVSSGYQPGHIVCRLFLSDDIAKFIDTTTAHGDSEGMLRFLNYFDDKLSEAIKAYRDKAIAERPSLRIESQRVH